MRVLLVNWIYGSGSTGIICQDIKNYLSSNHHVVKVACDINRSNDDEIIVFNSKIGKYIYWRLLRFGWPRYAASTSSVLKLLFPIHRFSPDIVHIHVLNNGSINLYLLLRILAKLKIKTVISHHAEFYYTGCCGYSYDCNQWMDNQCRDCKRKTEVTGARHWGNPHLMWKLMYNSINSFNPQNLLFTAVSPWVLSRSLQSPIVKKFDCEVVFNGIDTSIFYRRNTNGDIIKKIGFANCKKVLHVTADFSPSNKNHIKGGYYLVELAKLHPEILFVVVASTINDKVNLPNNVVLWGKAANREELADLYSIVDLTILTSYKETFSMICAESPCCGTPVVGFFAGGPESISISKYCKFVEYGNIQALSRAMLEVLDTPYDRNEMSKEAIKKYSKETMGLSYYEIYKKFGQ